ncbi:Non-functional NADPH-dependent codeinone reductase 2 [Acorus calamus]|uniref:Non-functional NADPH-dependent codeinone reductase 2 n=1 Tax=Acorus calamus TaxID=4465 RepID=A0AAV9CI60_ACOCL|nr:Non-functional NADPH-dependent codeinone reductase 2 [Acorus calamus]
MPLIGMGTAAYPFEVSDTTREAVLQAIELGYRHFDTAMIYQSEQPLGEAINEALRLGLIASRDELFVTSKLWCADSHGDIVVPALQKTLKNLQLEYLDLYLIHCGWSLKRGYYSFSVDPKDFMVLDIKSVWEGMEQCKRLGLTKAIGVSNFTQKKITQLLATAKIPPAVNQVEMNPLWQQKKMREFCKTRGIHVTAYSPLGAKGTPWGMNNVMESDVLKEIANGRGKSIAQVCLRWVYEQGVSVVVKSFNKRG